MKLFGYIRTTILDRDKHDQTTSLRTYGCREIFHEDCVDTSSVTLTTVLKKMRPGDALVVDQLKRIGKSTRQLAEWLALFEASQFHLICLEENIDTREESGQLFFRGMCHLAHMEEQLLKERTLLGLKKARKQGKIGGRPKIDPQTVADIRFLFFEKRETIQSIALTCNVSVGTCYKYVHLDDYELEKILQPTKQ